MPTDPSQQLYEDPETVQYYADRQQLLFSEETLLARAKTNITGKRVLDVGVGAGRTAPHLVNLQPASYVGVDYSSNMVENCRKRFPTFDFRVADARSMPEFADGSFDFIYFSWNGIDSVDYEGREAVVREAFRLLVPGGMFAFSSANGRNLTLRPWTITAIRNMGLRLSLKGIIHGAIQWMAGIVHFLSLRSHEVSHEDYSIRVDQAHNFKLLRCLVTPAQQKRQLLRSGFIQVTAIDREGAEQNPDDPAFTSCPVCYIALKPAA
jgi:ubiquinone/menaquinone biosynthesis C-methylase UbiE